MEEKKPDNNGDKEESFPTLDLLNADEDMIDELINKLHELEFQLSEIKSTINDELKTPSTPNQTSQDQKPSTSTDFPPVQFPPNFNPVFTVSPEMKHCAIPCTSPRSILTETAHPSGSTDNSDVQQPSSSRSSNRGDGPQVKSARRASWGPPRLLFPPQAATPREDEQNRNALSGGENPDEGFVENNPDEDIEEQAQPSNPLPSTPKRTPFDILGPFPFLHYPAQRFRANFNPVFTVSPEMQNCAIPCSPRSILTKPARPVGLGYSEVKQPSTSGRLSTGDAPEHRSTRRPSWISPDFPLSARITPRRTPRIVERTAEQQNLETSIVPEEINDQQNSDQRSIEQNSNEISTDEGTSGQKLYEISAENIPGASSDKPDEESTEHSREEEFIDCRTDEEYDQGNQNDRSVELTPDEEFVEANADDGSVGFILCEAVAPNTEGGSQEHNADIESHRRVCENSNPGPSNRMPSDCSVDVQPEVKQSSEPGPSTEEDAAQTKRTRRAKWGPPSLPMLLQVTTPRFTPRLVWQTVEEENGDDYEADIIEGDTHEDAEPEPEPEAVPEVEPEPEVHEPSDEDLRESDEDTDEDSLSSTDSSDITDEDSTPSSDTDDEFDVDYA